MYSRALFPPLHSLSSAPGYFSLTDKPYRPWSEIRFLYLDCSTLSAHSFISCYKLISPCSDPIKLSSTDSSFTKRSKNISNNVAAYMTFVDQILSQHQLQSSARIKGFGILRHRYACYLDSCTPKMFIMRLVTGEVR